MGAWGAGAFDNDAAGDWLDDLLTAGKPRAIDKALTKAVQAKPGDLEADDASAAIAAAEVIAAARGHRAPRLPEEAREWLATSGYVPAKGAVKMAIQATLRVREDSELADLWADGADPTAWRRVTRGLLSRLKKPAKKPKAQKSPVKDAKTSGSRKAGTVRRHKGFYFGTQRGKSAPNICVGGDQLRDADMEHLRQFPELEDLSLSGFKITDAGLQALEGLTRLRSLELKGLSITDACAPVFDRLTGLKRLHLNRTRIGDAVLERVGRMKKLTELSLAGTSVTDAGLKRLQACTRLRDLDLNTTRITDAGLRRLARLPALNALALLRTAVTSKGVRHLRPLADRLVFLRLDGTAIKDDACTALASFHRLDWLTLAGTKITGAGLKKLTSLKELTFLCIDSIAVGDKDVPVLLKFPNRTRVVCQYTKISEKGKRLIEEAGRTMIVV